MKTEDEAERKKILSTLKLYYASRFAIDTAYQELKLQEIEQRAAKLRAEVNKRAASQEEWVSAMVTLDKMRANGISTMESGPNSNTTSLPLPVAGIGRLPVQESSFEAPSRNTNSRYNDSNFYAPQQDLRNTSRFGNAMAASADRNFRVPYAEQDTVRRPDTPSSERSDSPGFGE